MRGAARYDRSVEAILFDWDGTLVDSLGAFHRANAVVLESFGLPFDEIRYRRHYTADWREMYRRLGVPIDRLDEANALWNATFGSDGDTVAAFPGARGALERLRRGRAGSRDVRSARARRESTA